MERQATLRAWNFGFAPAIAGAAPGMYFVLANIGNWQSPIDALGAFAIWFFRDFILAFFLAVPAAALMRWLGASPVWYWLSASVLGFPMGFVLADPLMEWHPTVEQIDAGFQVHTMVVYSLLFGLGAFAYGKKVAQLGTRPEAIHAV